MTTCDFATFVYAGDIHRLYIPGQLKQQVESNGYEFNQIYVVHQLCDPFVNGRTLWDICDFPLAVYMIGDIDKTLESFGIDINKPQYVSSTDNLHTWKQHVVNHIAAIGQSKSDYIVLADSDCWMIKQPDSWVGHGIEVLQSDPSVFIVSPNDGEPERKTQTMSQQMFLVRTEDFRRADWNQPEWDGNPHVLGGPLPEYWSMLEGRMELYCRYTNRYRYVLPSEYRYWHFNRTTQDGQLETDLGKY